MCRLTEGEGRSFRVAITLDSTEANCLSTIGVFSCGCSVACARCAWPTVACELYPSRVRVRGPISYGMGGGGES